METIESYFKTINYPGRGIVVGANKTLKEMFIAYFIMGRSENSKNRIFELDEEKSLKTKPFKKEKVENEDLIIYRAMAKFKEKIIISNGRHTETIIEGLKKGKTFSESLKETSFEQDPPILTPRISAILELDEPKIKYTLSIIKSNQNETSVKRFFYSFQPPLKEIGHLIHTYKPKENNETNSFFGEPIELKIPETLDEFEKEIWNSLNQKHKISLFTMSINIETKEEKTKIINKNS